MWSLDPSSPPEVGKCSQRIRSISRYRVRPSPYRGAKLVIIAIRNGRRGVLGILAAAVLAGGAIAIVMLPSAKGDPEPCTAANLSATISKVNQDISQYLQAHPDTNQALTDVAKQSPYAAQSAFTDYFKGNTAA